MQLVKKLRSKAKINLFLHVNGKLENGYHEIESLFYFPDIFDEIEVYRSDKIGLDVKGRFADVLNNSVNQNLIMVIYYSLKSSYPEIPNLHFVLNKNLPVAAGVGGGSGNAACVMRFLIEQYNLPIDEMRMIELAKKIGADVPPSLFEKSCIVSGIGEKIDFNISVPDLHILLINPMKEVLTRDIFKKGFSEFRNKLNNVQYVFDTQQDLVLFLKEQTENTLRKNAIEICPEIKNLEDILADQEGCLFSRMTGSGSTVFGIFEDAKSKNDALKKLTLEYPRYLVLG